MKQIMPLFILIFAFTACQKEVDTGSPGGNSLVMQGKFQTEMTVQLKPMVMYVQNRQITDPAIINPYLARFGYTAFFSTAATQTVTDTIQKLTFGNDDSVSFKVSLHPDIFYTKKSLTSPGEWTLQRLDTIITHTQINPPPFGPSRCDTITGFVNKIKPVSYFVNVPANNLMIQYLVPRFAIQVINEELNLPMITMVTNTYWNYPGSTGSCLLGTVDRFNINKGNIESNLLPKDTIVVQEKNVKLVKVM